MHGFFAIFHRIHPVKNSDFQRSVTVKPQKTLLLLSLHHELRFYRKILGFHNLWPVSTGNQCPKKRQKAAKFDNYFQHFKLVYLNPFNFRAPLIFAYVYVGYFSMMFAIPCCYSTYTLTEEEIIGRTS